MSLIDISDKFNIIKREQKRYYYASYHHQRHKYPKLSHVNVIGLHARSQFTTNLQTNEIQSKNEHFWRKIIIKSEKKERDIVKVIVMEK